jgi:hypothetical protein
LALLTAAEFAPKRPRKFKSLTACGIANRYFIRFLQEERPGAYLKGALETFWHGYAAK